MINNKLIKYIFIKNLDEKTKKNIKKFNNINIIYNNEDFNNISLKQCIEIRNFCFKNRIYLYVINNYKIAVKIKANGIFISSPNRRVNLGCSYLKKLHIIGSAHNQLEY
jgi:thiamine-phosphate pyrophosphorylase